MMYKENLGKCSVLEVSLCFPFPDPLTRESRVLLGLFWFMLISLSVLLVSSAPHTCCVRQKHSSGSTPSEVNCHSSALKASSWSVFSLPFRALFVLYIIFKILGFT